MAPASPLAWNPATKNLRLNEHLASLSVLLYSSHAGAAIFGCRALLIPFWKQLRTGGICAVEAHDVERNGAPARQV